jgi:signal transduction histidine kinase/CheY-like chemotaxis protein
MTDNQPAASLPPSEPGIAFAARHLTAWAPRLVAVMAAAVLTGWLLHVDALLRAFSDSGSMKANTALGLLLASLSLIARQSPAPGPSTAIRAGRHAIGMIGSLLLIGLSIATLSEYAFGIDLHIDQFLAADSPTTAIHPGRMSLLTDLSFGFLAAALVLWNDRTASGLWYSHVFLTVTAAIGFAVMVFHLYGVSGIEALAASSDMATHTAIAFQALVISAFAARLDRGMVAVVCSDTDAGAAARRSLLVALFVLTGVSYVRLVGERAGMYSTATGLSILVNIYVFSFVLLILRSARTLMQSEAERRRIAEDLQGVMNVMPAAIGIAHDRACARITANPFFSRILGAPRDANVSKSAPIDGPQTYRIMRDGHEITPAQLPMQVAARESRAVFDWEADIVRDDGVTTTLLGNAAPLADANQRVRGSVGAFVDITDRKRIERDREQALAREREARADAEAANRSKDEFLANLSHELRTPLNAMLGWLRLLRSGKLTPARQEHAIETIERNANAQLVLVEDLLDLSGVVTGRLQLDIRPVDLVAIVEAALDASRPAAQAKHIDLRLHASVAPRPCAGDPRRLLQIFSNLIANAVKFTPEGGTVAASVEYSDETAKISVADTGRGVSPQFLPYVFDRFRQEDSGSTRQYGGMGLGLAIVRHLVELHEGSVTAESEGRGRGARFIVTLPLVSVVAPLRTTMVQRRAEVAGQDRTVAVSLQGIGVLVVEDDPDSRALLTTILQQGGATVTDAASAPEALDILRRHRPDVLVTDLGMPGTDGFELIRLLRNDMNGALRSIPAIAVTGYARAEDRTAALAAGFQAHLRKPVNEAELCATVAAFGRLATGGSAIGLSV